MKIKTAAMIILTMLAFVLSQVSYAPLNAWFTKAPMPTKRGQAVVITGDDDLIYVMGGGWTYFWNFTTTVEAYDPLTDTWITKTPLPHREFGAAGAKGLDGTIYVISGGGSGSTGENAFESVEGPIMGFNSSSPQYLPFVQAYNPTTDTWTLKSSIPIPVWAAGATTGDDGKIYVIGGEYTWGYTPGDWVQVYDPTTDTWTLKTPMPTPRYQLGVVKGSDGLIYAIGGCTFPDGFPFSAITTVEAYDPMTDTWTTKASLPTPLCQFGVTLGPDGKIYVIGGGKSYYNNSPPFYRSVYSYDVNTDTWTTELSMPTARRELGATTWHNSIYAIGGGNTYLMGPYLDTNEEAVLLVPTVPATIDIDPDVLNLKSDGEWITAYIELMEDQSVDDIDVSTVKLNNSISVDLDAPVEVGDYDGDGVQDLMVKFSRTEVISYIIEAIDFPESARFIEVSLTVTGELFDRTPFEGSDTIRVIIPRYMASMSNL